MQTFRRGQHHSEHFAIFQTAEHSTVLEFGRTEYLSQLEEVRAGKNNQTETNNQVIAKDNRRQARYETKLQE